MKLPTLAAVSCAMIVAIAYGARAYSHSDERPRLTAPRSIQKLSVQSSLASKYFVYPEPVSINFKFPAGFNGKHTLEGRWYTPNSELQEHTIVPIEFSNGSRNAFLYLQFKQPSLLDNLKFGTTSDEDHSRFIGDWHLDTFCDGIPIASSTFSVVNPSGLNTPTVEKKI